MSGTAFDLCHTLLELGDAVSRNLHLSYGCDISYGEETITESCLLEIWRRHSAIVHIETFTKRNEALNGADWEWHLIGRAYTFRMRVQAKRLAKNAKKFRSLFTYTAKNASSPQVDMLIHDAKTQKLMPVLCLYSPEYARRHWKANNMPRGLQAGCLIGDAVKVKATGNNDLISLEKITIPWHALVCPQRKASAAFPSISFLNRTRGATAKGLPEYIVPTDGVRMVSTLVSRQEGVERGVMGRVRLDLRQIG